MTLDHKKNTIHVFSRQNHIKMCMTHILALFGKYHIFAYLLFEINL